MSLSRLEKYNISRENPSQSIEKRCTKRGSRRFGPENFKFEGEWGREEDQTDFVCVPWFAIRRFYN